MSRQTGFQDPNGYSFLALKSCPWLQDYGQGASGWISNTLIHNLAGVVLQVLCGQCIHAWRHPARTDSGLGVQSLCETAEHWAHKLRINFWHELYFFLYDAYTATGAARCLPKTYNTQAKPEHTDCRHQGFRNLLESPIKVLTKLCTYFQLTVQSHINSTIKENAR